MLFLKFSIELNDDTKRLLLLQAKGGVKGHGFQGGFATKVFGGQAHSIFRLVALAVDGQAFRAGVVGRFDLDGDDRALALDDEVDLGLIA